jgi:uncharacterized protein YutE (UPF0331/DUF86 family)
MDRASLKVLEAEIKDQLEKIDQVYDELEDRAARIQSGGLGYIESTAYQLHNLYNAIEDLFKIVAGAFENNVTDLSRWHTELLRRMTLTIEGIRPALISKESAGYLDELRAFRHVFRHAYNIHLDPRKIEENVKKARLVRPLLPRDIQTFLHALGISDDEN